MKVGNRVALVSGFWGQNIGNAFFNIGGKYILDTLFGDGQVAFIQDQPGYRTFHDQSTGNPASDWGLIGKLDVEYIVLQGPMLTVNFQPLWERTFTKLRKRGTKIILLGAALFKFTDEEINTAKKFLSIVQPDILSTRDHETYLAVRETCRMSYSGIDSAFFAPKAYTPHRLVTRPYVAVNFDRLPEPTFSVTEGIQNTANDEGAFAFQGNRWSYSYPKLQRYLASRGKGIAYIGHLLDRRKLPRHIADLEVVRPEHRYNPYIKWKVYKNVNGIASDEPYTYLTTYANAALTLSDRVHACVATLSYGGPAMLYSPTKRAKLFDRLRLSDIRKQPVALDLDYLEQERQNELNFLIDAIAKLS